MASRRGGKPRGSCRGGGGARRKGKGLGPPPPQMPRLRKTLGKDKDNGLLAFPQVISNRSNTNRLTPTKSCLSSRASNLNTFF